MGLNELKNAARSYERAVCRTLEMARSARDAKQMGDEDLFREFWTKYHECIREQSWAEKVLIGAFAFVDKPADLDRIIVDGVMYSVHNYGIHRIVLSEVVTLC